MGFFDDAFKFVAKAVSPITETFKKVVAPVVDPAVTFWDNNQEVIGSAAMLFPPTAPYGATLKLAQMADGNPDRLLSVEGVTTAASALVPGSDVANYVTDLGGGAMVSNIQTGAQIMTGGQKIFSSVLPSPSVSRQHAVNGTQQAARPYASQASKDVLLGQVPTRMPDGRYVYPTADAYRTQGQATVGVRPKTHRGGASFLHMWTYIDPDDPWPTQRVSFAYATIISQ